MDEGMLLRTLRCAIENLDDWYPHLFLEAHGVACVAVLSRYSGSPAMVEVACEGISSRWLRQDSAFSAKGHRIRVSRHDPAEQ
jgi:hypothetical protein